MTTCPTTVGLAGSVATTAPLLAHGISVTDLEVLALQAYDQGRACLAPLQDDVNPILGAQGVLGPRRLVQRIEDRRILDQRFTDELGWLITDIGRAVERGTTHALRSTAEFEGHVGEPRFWRETCRVPEAERLAQAGAKLTKLRELVLGVLDMLRAEQAIDRIRNKL